MDNVVQPEVYGTQLPAHPLAELVKYAGNPPYTRVLFYPPIPVDARQCQWPGSIKVQLILENNTVLTGIRLLDGSVRYQGC